VSPALAAWSRHLPAGAEVEAVVAGLGKGSLPEAFHSAAVRAEDRSALDIDGDRATHAELDDRAARGAGALRERGVQAGDAVLLAAPSSLNLVVAYLSALRAGATVVLANPTYTAAELRHLATDSRAVAAFGAGPPLEHLRELQLRVVGAVGDVGDGPALAPEPPPPGRPALLAYTSGTTGRPKAVGLTHANLLASIRAIMLAWRWSEDDVLVHGLPLFHQHGLGGVHATLLAGARAVLLGRFEPGPLARAIERERATVLFAVPAMYERLASGHRADAEALGSLRLLVSGSAPLSPKLAQRIADLSGQMPLERYGTTESGLNVSNPLDGPRRVGTVGVPLPGVELAIADDTGAPVPDGENGEILLRGPQVFDGYVGDPEATAAAFSAGGWFRTGDLGHVDPDDGYLLVTGRAKELIITGGMNVSPREVELALEEAPGVALAAVAGAPSERWGEEVIAAVVAVAGETPDPDAIIAHARTVLAPYKCPKRVVVVEDLPRNPMGKVVRTEVAMLVERGSA
jgi:malonyl-CoA/methylmalonyl-CoA synthetase